MEVRLDSWHFMRRMARACTSETHPLHATFIMRLSSCVYEWDYLLLVDAKRGELRQAGVSSPPHHLHYAPLLLRLRVGLPAPRGCQERRAPPGRGLIPSTPPSLCASPLASTSGTRGTTCSSWTPREESSARPGSLILPRVPSGRPSPGRRS